MGKLVETKVKCPKCKSTNLTLNEVWDGHGITWEQIDGKIERQQGILEPGDPYKVHAECDQCRHRWTVRGALQIDDVCL